jgi:hypothetical protein
MGSHKRRCSTGSKPNPLILPPDTLAEMEEQMLRQWLDESIPALGGLTPREAYGCASASTTTRPYAQPPQGSSCGCSTVMGRDEGIWRLFEIYIPSSPNPGRYDIVLVSPCSLTRTFIPR